MTRDEAIARGLKPRPTVPSMQRRAPWHNYHHPGMYMLTLVVAGRRPLFGRIVAHPTPHIELSALGHTILHDEIPKINAHYPQVYVWRTCMMPDHMHMIVRVAGWLKENEHLGLVVRGFKSGCNNAYWQATGDRGHGLFEPKYNDRLLLEGEQMARWQHYLDDNPRRLLLKRLHPDLFTVMRDMEIAGQQCQAIGNTFLLDIPDKMAVVVHRRYSDEEYERLQKEWLACGERGGVLVSAAIAPREKAVLREAMNRGYRIILLRENGFPPLYKPAGEAFDSCAQGLLLQISPWQYHTTQQTITRAQCLHLNALAEKIATPQ